MVWICRLSSNDVQIVNVLHASSATSLRIASTFDLYGWSSSLFSRRFTALMNGMRSSFRFFFCSSSCILGRWLHRGASWRRWTRWSSGKTMSWTIETIFTSGTGRILVTVPLMSATSHMENKRQLRESVYFEEKNKKLKEMRRSQTPPKWVPEGGESFHSIPWLA